MIAAVGRRLRPRARRRQATRTARARSSTASSRQRRSRLHTVVKGGNVAGSRRQAQPSRARCHNAWSMIRVDQTRSRPDLGLRVERIHRPRQPHDHALPQHLLDRRRVLAPVLGRPCHPRRPRSVGPTDRCGSSRRQSESHADQHVSFRTGSETRRRRTCAATGVLKEEFRTIWTRRLRACPIASH